MVERDRLIAALEDATHASSIHNSQPWRFRLVEGGVAVHLDPTVTPRTVDPVGRWALASIGAVVANLELALTSRTGRAVVTEITLGDSIPEAADLAGGAAYGEGPLAVITLGEAAETTTAMTAARLHGAIKERHTTRGPLLGGPPTEEEWAELQAAVAWAPGIQATPASEPLVRSLLSLTARAEDARQEDEDYLEEIQNWVENEAPSGTGIPRGAIGAPDAEGHVPIRDFTQTPMGSSGDGEAVFFEDPPALLVLHAASDTPVDQLRAGYAMQRAMLEATALGLGIGVLGQALEEPDSRAAVDGAAEESFGAPVVVHQILRLGHPAGTITYAATPRRPVTDLILD
ncbi:Acg family FMN-binding oxidoreductase [Serinibacter salmoneus]|uniref:Nitroreductase n=1 Tax=Serinibacter salmoneus TaxID=556530 RepID=A0A2A9CXY4_9MICO|nr:nitroreductase family protein [Serinibacter salmoneus]PFG18996.1 nitroreductase [Serinibacter salmoneus]